MGVEGERESEREVVNWRSEKVVDLKIAILCCYWPPRSKWLAGFTKFSFLLNMD